MKLLIVGANHSQAIENHFIKHLSNFLEVDFINTHGEHQEYYYKSVINKIKVRLGISSIFKKLNADLLDFVRRSKPDALLIFKGMELLPSTLETIKKQGIILTNYNPDHPTQHFSRGSGNQNIIDNIPFYDHHFCYSKDIQAELESRFNSKTSWLPFAFVHSKRNQSTDLIRRVCFLGNPDQIRSEILNYLLLKKVPIQLIGYNWEKVIESKYISNGHCKILESRFDVNEAQKYAVQLNIFRPHNEGSHNLRTFEMTPIGTIMLAPYSKEHIELFKENKEAFYYKNKDELLHQCNYLLSLDENEIRQIQNKAYERAIKSEYGYKGRSKQVYRVLKDLHSQNRLKN